MPVAEVDLEVEVEAEAVSEPEWSNEVGLIWASQYPYQYPYQ